MKINFYDTSSLLLRADNLFDDTDAIGISSITLEELEHIKTASNKDPDIKYSARKLVHLLDEHINDYQVCIFNNSFENPILEKGISSTNDTKILSCALHLQNNGYEVCFITNDICLKHIAKLFLNNVESIKEDQENYPGYKEISMGDDEMAYFYEHRDVNNYDLLINEYLILKDSNNDVVDKLRWTGEDFRSLNYSDFSSKWFGKVKPMKDDIYQALVADSFVNNKITLVKGPAGSGKTYLSLAYLLNRLEKGKIDRIIIFCNTVATKDSAKLGLI